MSYDELEKHGIFLPESHWGESQLNRPSSPWLLAGLGTVAGAACIGMVLGRGGAVTWLCAGLFLLTLWGFTWAATRAIDRQNRRVEQVKGDGPPGHVETGDEPEEQGTRPR